MKYYKKDTRVYAFESDGSQDQFISNEFVAMTESEVDHYIHPDKYWTDGQRELERLKQFQPLTRRQFKLTLLEYDLLKKVETEIDSLADEKLKVRIQLEYREAESFERLSESVLYMIDILKLTIEQVDQMWTHALAL